MFISVLQFSAIAIDSEKRDSSHAEDVMVIAKDYFKLLGSKNIFKPKALAKVSRRDKWFVGSSVAVSEFLRPLCLYTRIAQFKQSLKKAIASNQPLVTECNLNWSSSAFALAKDPELKPKPPCQNCTMVFQSLEGFIATSEQGGSGTFLGACAEYCPVDQLLENEALPPKEKQLINDKLQRNREQSTVLFENFRDIEKGCDEAMKNLKDLSKDLRCKVHIFGVKPECNMYFGGRN